VRPLFVLRWAARDLRRRWLQVAAIALIIAIGTGVYSALGSTAAWRRESNDDSFELLAMYDLRVRAAEGADAATGAMRAVLDELPDRGMVEVAEERLVVGTQVDASRGDETILVPGRIVGVDVSGGGPHVNGIFVGDELGRGLTDADVGQPVVVLERNFAQFYDLPSEGDLRVAGGAEVRYVGQGLAPEYFFVMTEEGAFFAEANFAVVFAPLETAQELAGRPRRVNDLVLRLRDGVDPIAAAETISAAFAASGTGLGVTVMQTGDEDAYRILYDDIEGDQRFWNILAGLILLGAAFGAFNLASRMIEAQRREIGVGMALGESPRQLALRPLLAGAQMSVLGAVFGVGMGLLVIVAIRPIYTSMLPLPVWHTELQWGMFLRGAALGFALPLAATAWPVWRAVRVTPIDAITTTHRTARGGLAPLLRRLPWPTSAFRRMPLGNVLRAPRRTILTALGIGAAISTLVATLGLLDTFTGTMERNDSELLQVHPDRLVVGLDRIVLAEGPEVAAIAADPTVGAVDPLLRVGGRLDAGGAEEPLDVLVEAVDLDSGIWAPTLTDGVLGPERAGLVIARKAASDLGVDVGDMVTLEHPARDGTGVSVVRTEMTVAGIHPSPFRFNVYIDRSQLATFGADGLANQLNVLPAAGRTADEVQRALFELDTVGSVQPVAALSRVLTESLSEFTSVFRVLEGFILLLALLMAYNATSINADERARERATLFAFGLPLRRVIGLETVEGVLIGLAGTAVGIGVGVGVIRWLTAEIVTTTMPDIGLDVAVGAGTVVTAMVLGVVAVAVAPLLTIRRLRRMDIPGTLRVVE
jgi:putative ABC transport system permease protein